LFGDFEQRFALAHVGAVAVLFLFVVMMLDVDLVAIREGFLQYLPIGGLIGIILLVELLLVLGTWIAVPETAAVAGVPIPPPDQVSNTRALGAVLYTKYVYLFQASGLILLVAMIGAIVLTLRRRDGVRRQSISEQVGRRRDESVEVKKVPSRSGV